MGGGGGTAPPHNNIPATTLGWVWGPKRVLSHGARDGGTSLSSPRISPSEAAHSKLVDVCPNIASQRTHFTSKPTHKAIAPCACGVCNTFLSR